jgi:hypothetical protein
MVIGGIPMDGIIFIEPIGIIFIEPIDFMFIEPIMGGAPLKVCGIIIGGRKLPGGVGTIGPEGGIPAKDIGGIEPGIILGELSIR